MRAIGPAWSRLQESGTTPFSETLPRVGLIVEVPEHADGIRSDPAVSVPVAAGTMRAASAAADPPLEPPAERSRLHGLPTWSVVPPAANSWVWRWPSRIMPAERRRLQTSQSSAGTSSSSRLEAVIGLPATPYRSFSPTGTPVSAGGAPSRRTPAALRRSSARVAAASASSS